MYITQWAISCPPLKLGSVSHSKRLGQTSVLQNQIRKNSFLADLSLQGSKWPSFFFLQPCRQTLFAVAWRACSMEFSHTWAHVHTPHVHVPVLVVALISWVLLEGNRYWGKDAVWPRVFLQRITPSFQSLFYAFAPECGVTFPMPVSSRMQTALYGVNV